MTPDDEYPRLLGALLSPFGESPARRDAERALTVLLRDYRDRARADLLDAVRAVPDGLQVPAVLEVLPLFGGADQVPLLESLMGGEDDDIAARAGIALGRLREPEAHQAVRRALASPSVQVLSAGADAAGVRGDAALCGPLRDRFDHPSPEARYHVAHALRALGCLTADERAELVAAEPDADVAALLRNP